MMTLRSFCGRSLSVLAGLTFTPWTVARDAVRCYRRSLADLRFENFAAQLNSVFEVDCGADGMRTVRLVTAERAKRSARANPKALDAAYEKFSLVFADRHARRLEQRSHVFKHPRFGRFEMFIVPVGSLDRAVHKYEAVFNRPIEI